MKWLACIGKEKKWEIYKYICMGSESVLDDILYYNPHLIPTSSMGRKPLILVASQFNIGNGYADLMAIDEDYKIVLIECKRAHDPRSKKPSKALEQLYEYGKKIQGISNTDFMSAIQKLLKIDYINCPGFKFDETQKIALQIAEVANQQRKIYKPLLVLAVDELDNLPDIQKKIELRNKRNKDIFALEINPFVEGEQLLIRLFPSQPTPNPPRATFKTFQKDLEKTDPELYKIIMDLLKYAKRIRHDGWLHWGYGYAFYFFNRKNQKGKRRNAIFYGTSKGEVILNLPNIKNMLRKNESLIEIFAKHLVKAGISIRKSDIVDSKEGDKYNVIKALRKCDNLYTFKKAIAWLINYVDLGSAMKGSVPT